ncbi:MAG: adenosine kinase [Spirochaetota bacterium]|nr:adenosine kinase [Spirochaetota bacterium]
MSSEFKKNEKNTININNYNKEDSQYDIVGIGSPLLDYIIQVDDVILTELDLKKGHMHLIDEEKSRAILQRMEDYSMDITPGGSSANSLAGISNFGGKTLLLGKVGHDSNGERYIYESHKAGIDTRLSKHEGMTGHAITFITPDSERTFATHLGAALHFTKDDIVNEDILNCKILHIEGYILEPLEFREAAFYAMEIARSNNILISIDLADPSLIQRIRNVFTKAVTEYADIVFVNEDEAKEFTGEEEEEALDILHSMCSIAVVKLGERGSLIKKDREIYRIPSYQVDVVNTNGAGDMYAAGVLYGIVKDIPIERAGRIGSYSSSLVVARIGARLEEKIDIDNIE